MSQTLKGFNDVEFLVEIYPVGPDESRQDFGCNLQGCKAGRKRQARSEEGEMSGEEHISCLIFEGHTTMLPINSLIYPSAISDA